MSAIPSSTSSKPGEMNYSFKKVRKNPRRRSRNYFFFSRTPFLHLAAWSSDRHVGFSWRPSLFTFRSYMVEQTMSDESSITLLFRRINRSTLHTHLIDIVSSLLFVLGIVGNVLGLFLFSSSRRSRRISSSYVILATSSSIVNLLCVVRYAFILHSVSRKHLQHLVGHVWWACKGYELSFCIRVISSWITLYWMFERLLCVSKRLRSCFNAWKSYKIIFPFPFILLLLILISVIGPPVYMFQPDVRRWVSSSIARCGVKRILC